MWLSMWCVCSQLSLRGDAAVADAELRGTVEDLAAERAAGEAGWSAVRILWSIMTI